MMIAKAVRITQINKQANIYQSSIDIQKALPLINKYTRKALTEEEVYCFPIILCDNDVDRDNECFTVGTLNSLSKLFLGKTGISDHNPKSSNQTARIYDTEVVTDSTKMTSYGEPYTFLKGYAYMVKTNSNNDLVKEIDAGIKKEVSVSCSIEKAICSICGTDRREKMCEHRKGNTYNGKSCYIKLENPTDAYEWSFVAVPAQRNAGVTKKYDGNEVKNDMDYAKVLKSVGIDISDTDTEETVLEKCKGIMKPKDVELTIVDNEDKSKSIMNGETEIFKVEANVVEKEKIIDNTDTTVKAKADQFDIIKNEEIDNACANGIKAKGDKFDKGRWTKLFNDFSIAEIKSQSQEWLDEASEKYHAGVHKSVSETESYIEKVNTNDYKLD